MDDLEKVNDDGSPFIKEPEEIHTVFVIKNGSFDVWTSTRDKDGKLIFPDLEGKRYVYRLHSRVSGYACVDYDKNSMVPLAKDIFNRQNTFIEITYLKILMGITAASLLLCVIMAFVMWRSSTPNFDAPKAEIIKAVKDAAIIIQTQKVQNTGVESGFAGTGTKTNVRPDWHVEYNPVMPEAPAASVDILPPDPNPIPAPKKVAPKYKKTVSGSAEIIDSYMDDGSNWGS